MTVRPYFILVINLNTLPAIMLDNIFALFWAICSMQIRTQIEFLLQQPRNLILLNMKAVGTLIDIEGVLVGDS